jgi:hypothetical protein
VAEVPDRWDVLKEAIRSDISKLNSTPASGSARDAAEAALAGVLAKMEALEPGGAWYAGPGPEPVTFGFSYDGGPPLDLVIRADGSRLTLWDVLPDTDPPAYRARGTYEWVEVHDGRG